ncbi:hypothetical protein [Carnobacterium maltaromaticum]|uniref:YobI family P-loop NTPase n=1 Tax=Carnobacterium maltaromaticum TaxID=2751 RepID=UPI00295F2CD9|nr:hypothetical protein [Carnobacterium maltaromaticum]
MKEVITVVYWILACSVFFIVFFSKDKIIKSLENRIKKLSKNLKYFYFKKIKQLSKLLRGISNKLDRKSNQDNFKWNSLSPKLLVDEKEELELEKISPYIERIDEGVRNPDVKNLALMGSYGSGKSTIIKNFTFEHPEYNILNLSLGSYSKKETSQQTPDGGYQDSNDDDLNEKLENSLVKQMIYREKNSKLPYSRFKKINPISSKLMNLFFLLFLGAVISFLYLTNFLHLKDILLSNSEMINNNTDRIDLFIYSIFSISSLFIFFQFLKTVMTQFKLSKLNFANVSIEGNENNSSYFNKYIDEILYYFGTQKFDVVVIEDVDRFRSVKVFEHLKELNILLNNSKQIDRKITFVYALSEDIFSNSVEDSKEHESEIRTKFFEFIIPVLPVVDTFNSRDYLVPMMLEKSDESLDTEFITFLKDIALYIQDLRLLTNIVNEYLLYLDIHKSLSESMIKQSLFSIIALKNLMPSEYCELQKSKGFIYDLVVKKVHDDKMKEDIEAELEEIKKGFDKIEVQVKIDKISETKKFLFDQGVSISDKIVVNNKKIALAGMTIETIESMLGETGEIIFATSFGHQIKINHSDFIKVITEKDEVLKDRMQKKQKELDLKKNELETFLRLSLKQKLKNYPELVNLIFNENTDDYSDVKDFILYALSNGYIDEDYPSYLSVFYGGKSMTFRDKQLLLKLKSNQKIELDVKVDNIKEFVKELSPHDYDAIGILNVNILNYLFSIEHKMHDAVLKKIFEQDKQDYLGNLEIMLGMDKSDTANIFFKLLERYNGEFLIKFYWDRTNEIDNDLINQIFYSCLGDHSSPNDIEDRKKVLFEAIAVTSESDPEVLVILDNILGRDDFFVEIEEYVDTDKLMNIMDEYNEEYCKENDSEIIEFTEIVLSKLSLKQFTKFIECHLYKYTHKTFSGILNYENKGTVKEVSYHEILSSENENLIEHTNNNLTFFVGSVLLSVDRLSEDTYSFLKLLNSTINDEYKTKLIKKSNVTVRKLSEVPNLHREELLKEKKCTLTWLNLIDYYKNRNTENMNSEVLRSIFDNAKDISTLREQYDKDNLKNNIEVFLKELVDTNVIDVTVDNIKLINVAKYDAGTLGEKSIQLLVENNLVDFNLENMDKFKKDGVIIDLLINYPTKLIENYQEINLAEDELIKLINKLENETIVNLLETVEQAELDETFKSLIVKLMNNKISSDKLINEMSQEWNVSEKNAKKAKLLIGITEHSNEILAMYKLPQYEGNENKFTKNDDNNRIKFNDLESGEVKLDKGEDNKQPELNISKGGNRVLYANHFEDYRKEVKKIVEVNGLKNLDDCEDIIIVRTGL